MRQQTLSLELSRTSSKGNIAISPPIGLKQLALSLSSLWSSTLSPILAESWSPLSLKGFGDALIEVLFYFFLIISQKYCILIVCIKGCSCDDVIQSKGQKPITRSKKATQKEYVELYTGPDFNLDIRYAQVWISKIYYNI